MHHSASPQTQNTCEVKIQSVVALARVPASCAATMRHGAVGAQKEKTDSTASDNNGGEEGCDAHARLRSW